LLKINNYINILLFVILILLTIFFNSFNSISTELETILPKSEKKELLTEFNKFQNSKKIFLSVDGLDKESLIKIKKLEEKFIKIDGITLEKLYTNKKLEKYKEEYKFFIEDINKKNIEKLNINKKLEEIKFNLINSTFTFFIDNADPLDIFRENNPLKALSLKNNHLIIKDSAYLSIFKLDNSVNSISQYENIYDSIQTIVSTDENIKTFSSIFYFVENSRIIKEDVNNIIIFSTIVLLLLYIVILKDLKLLINTLITLSSSILISLFICSFIFDKLSIFVIVFGVSISTVAIDYMFHHYIHDFYKEKKGFNKDVFLGMITTVGSFAILSFVPFDLIKQLSYFSIISLLFSYLQFAFLYPKIKFSQKNFSKKYYKLYSKTKPIYVLFFAMLLIVLSIERFHFDLNLKNLDINNVTLKQKEEYFNNKLNLQKNIPVLIKGKSIDQLIENARVLKEQYYYSYIPISILVDEKSFLNKKSILETIDFNKIKNELNKESINLGFRDDYFKDAYILQYNKPIYTKELIDDFGIEIIKFKDSFLTYGNLPKDKAIEFSKYDFVENLSIKTMFEENLSNIYDELLIYGFVTTLFILVMIFLSTKDNFLISFTYVLFPISLIISLSYFISFNILHLFMLFVIISISIDFGIYLGSKNLDRSTYRAILYSLLSTFAGFGVLIFSKINALYSIGLIASIGILAISILIIILKRPFYDS